MYGKLRFEDAKNKLDSRDAYHSALVVLQLGAMLLLMGGHAIKEFASVATERPNE